MKTSWKEFIRCAIEAYQKQYPEDKRNVVELAESLHEKFYEDGLIKKNESGKFIIPETVDNWFIQ